MPSRSFSLAWQQAFLCSGRWLARGFLRGMRVEFAPEDLRPEMHYVLAVNHQAYFDTWFVPALLPAAMWRRMGRPRTFVKNVMFEKPVLGWVLEKTGCFRAKRDETRPYGLLYAQALMERGQSIIIFPEGRRTIRGEERAHRGVEVLAHLPKVMILPVHIEWTRRNFWWRTFRVTYGRPFNAEAMTAAEILERVYALPVDFSEKRHLQAVSDSAYTKTHE